MYKQPAPAIVLPSFIAGPAVLLFVAGAFWAEQFTNPIVLPIELLPAGFVFLVLACAIGVLPALVANTIGTAVMIKLGAWFPLLRFPLVWAVVGGLAAWAVVTVQGFGPEWTFAYTATGALSALLCRMRLA